MEIYLGIPNSWLKKEERQGLRSIAETPSPLGGVASAQVPPTVTQLPLRGWRCFYLLLTLNQPQLLQPAEEPRTEAWSLPTEHRCAKPLEYPCAGEARTDHPGGLPLSDRQKGKSRGESMAVEEEGLRIFQSVKIKIGKKENTPTPHPL